MAQADWIRLLIGAVLTTGLTLSGQFFILRYQHRQQLERDLLLDEQARARVKWDALLPRVSALKDTAGYLHIHLSGWGIIPSDEELGQHFYELDAFAAKFGEYPEMQRAIWDLLNTTGTLLRWQGIYTAPGESKRVSRRPVTLSDAEHKQREEVKTVELPKQYQALLAAADALLEAKRPGVTAGATESTQGWRRFLRRDILRRKPLSS